MQEIEGRAALITGASSGIGRATAEKLASHGVDVALAARSENKLARLAADIQDEYGVETLAVPTDVTEVGEVETMVEETVSTFGHLDIVVNNAGLTWSGDVEDMPDKHYENTMGVNVDGMFFTAREAIPHLKESGGNLVFLGSIAGKYPRGTNPVYAGTKWWTRGFALSLAAQLGSSGVGVTVVNPAEVRTDFNSEEGTAFQEAFEEGEVSEPEDVAEAIVYAVRQESRNTVAELDLYRRDKLEEMELG
ncbi:MAG: SDR family oxidoreductase [Candidatus Nanohaloarchaea archaeon]|nr:SDR family oxidoreductase [Candidatus Nanohaloarchaea archaeon]